MSLQIPEAELLSPDLPCALCGGSRSKRQLSHIIPSFVFKHASVRAPTGFLRNNVTPNRRIQDGPKDYVLCRDCEQRFSKWERSFADVYRRFYADPSKDICYSSSEAFCALSILWRVLHNARAHPELNHLQFGGDYSRTDAAYEAWSKALLDQKHPGKYRLYWIFFDRIVGGSQIPEGINTYIFHAIDFDLIANSKESLAYAHIPGMFIFGITEDHNSADWRDLRLRFNGGKYRHENRRAPGLIGDLIKEKVLAANYAKGSISASQNQKIRSSALKNVDKLMSSPLTQSVLADRSILLNR